MLFLLSHLLLLGSSRAQRCGDFTTTDAEGPFYVAGAPTNGVLAPRRELEDSAEAVVLQGRVLGRACKGVEGARVEVWYAGGDNAQYSFPPERLWYRGSTTTDQNGSYSFEATFPGRYSGRPIIHYHYKVTAKDTEFVTQIYFKNGVPRSYENYVTNRGSQFAQVTSLQNGSGRRVNVNLRLRV